MTERTRSREDPRRGWSLTNDASSEAPGLELVVYVGTTPRVFPLPATGSVSIGRAEGNEIRIDDASISRRHAALHLDGRMKVEDLGSANGTWIRPAQQGPETARIAESRLAPREPAQVAVGQPFHVGTALAIVRTAQSQGAADVIVLDAAMTALYESARRIAETPITVLLLGETGTGKEVLAEAIHRASPRREGPFVRLNCAALSEALLESELFGHERGAFTSAVGDKPGLFEVARGGTVFLDEIGELPATIQAKLLRVIEERKVLRVGALAPRPIDVRFVSATWRDLDLAVSQGSFRRDLYFRLDGISLRVPALRDRPAEIRALADLFLQRAISQTNRAGVVFADEVYQAFARYPWPGNIRELRNVVERAVALSTGVIREEHLVLSSPRALPSEPARTHSGARATVNADDAVEPRGRTTAPPAEADTGAADEGELRDALVSIEKKRIIDALAACAGNQTEAAAMLGVSRRTLINRLERYGISRPRKKA